MPRILSVLSLALLSLSLSSFPSLSTSVSASPSSSSSLTQSASISALSAAEARVEILIQNLKRAVDLRGDERPSGGKAAIKDCPMANMIAMQEAALLPPGHPVLSEPSSFASASVCDDSGSASDKAAAIWAKVVADKSSAPYPGVLDILKLLLEDVNQSMDTQGEVLPQGHKKTIHPVGSVALGSITWDKSLPFSGLFQSGASHVLLRLSTAKDPSNTAVTAGVAMKVFRDNQPSANTFALHSFDPTSWSFFHDNLQTHVSSQLPTFSPLRLVTKKFESASKYVFYTGLSDWARADEKGNLTPNAEIKFPFQMILVPNPTLRAAGELLKPDGKPFTNQFLDIQPGTLLYNIYIQDEPMAEPYVAGKVTLNADETGQLTTSMYADSTLFFRHQRFEEDFTFRPDWKQTCPKADTCDYMFNGN